MDNWENGWYWIILRLKQLIKLIKTDKLFKKEWDGTEMNEWTIKMKELIIYNKNRKKRSDKNAG